MNDKVIHSPRSQESATAALSETAISTSPTQETSMIWIIVAVVCIGSFMGQLDASITQLVLPALEREFSASVGEVSWVALIFLLAVTVMLPVFILKNRMETKKCQRNHSSNQRGVTISRR